MMLFGAGLEIDSPEFNRYIWNNFWKNATGNLKANDARFQTYVKGNYYGFKDSNGNHTVFTNNYNYVYYGHENETENFVFEEHSISNGDFLAIAEELWQRVVRDKPHYGGTSDSQWQSIINGGTIDKIDCSGYVSAAINLSGYPNFARHTTWGNGGLCLMDISPYGTVVASGFRK